VLFRSGPGYMHFPADRDINYFAQLTAERSIVKIANGQKYRVWELPPGRANEALDCRVYGYAALCGLFHLGLKLNQRADDVAAPVVIELPEPTAEVDAAVEEKPAWVPGLQAAPAVITQPVKKSLASRLA
ncbi:MAG TPA: terminase, partial [Cupriavidus sp.]|nr:terminase [Cupriavidus sp.]